MANDWDERYDNFERNPTRQGVKGVAHGGIVIAVVIAVVLAIGVALWAGGVFTSDLKGQGDSVKIKNEAGNRIRAQEGFLDKYNAIIVADKNLTITAESLAKTPESVKLQTELAGQKMICNDLVGIYNGAAKKFTQQDFKDAELPDVIDESKSDTDCKE